MQIIKRIWRADIGFWEHTVLSDQMEVCYVYCCIVDAINISLECKQRKKFRNGYSKV